MVDSTSPQPAPDGEVLQISAVLEPAVRSDVKQLQLRFEAGGPFETPGSGYLGMINEIAQACTRVARRMLGPEAMNALVNEAGMMPGAQVTLFSLSYMASGQPGEECTFSVETAVHPDLALAQDRLVIRVAEECKEATLPIFTRLYPDCSP
ncbi:MAG TPA: hypothetical protein PK089_07240 [Methanoregulaceae archaeon]|nr:hypothetical protein [Methanoregulaceae archaeon]HQJ87722.1 hypothetical protein [Methanoregulaceae archaeon]